MVTPLINGKAIAQDIQSTLKKEVKHLVQDNGFNPNVVTITVGNNPSSELYLKLRDKACRSIGIISEHQDFETTVSENEVLNTINELNNNTSVHGIMVQYPLPPHISQLKVMSSIYPNKDVEGLHPKNLGRTLLGDEWLVPCTPQAVLKIFDFEKIDLQGQKMVIINHSNVVGKPLAVLCLNRNATVSVCHEFTQDLKQFTQHADILISATGIPGIITGEYIKKDVIIIDVGIVATEDGIVGDVAMKSVEKKAKKLTPVPGGVGPVTIAASLSNMLKVFKKNI